MKLFGVRFGSWVEIRESPTKPKTQKSTIQVTKNGKVVKITNLHHIGGRVIGTMRLGIFIQTSGYYPSNNELVEVISERVDRVRSKL